MSAPAVPNAGWPPAVLLRRFERSGRGDLGDAEYRGVVAVLSHLANAVQDQARKGKSRDGCRITMYQLAQRAGYSERWTRTCLHYLEELGLVVWFRGRYQGGRAKPSWITIQRHRLVALVRDAMKLGDRRDAEHVQAVRDKIAAMGSPRWLQSRRKAQPEAASTPHPQGGLGPAPAGQAKREPRQARGTHSAGRPPKEVIPFLPDVCYHVAGDPQTCRACRTAAYSEMKAAPRQQGPYEIPPPVVGYSQSGAGLFDIHQAVGPRHEHC